MSGDARDLKRRLRGVLATQQVTKAMKTVSVSKYNRVLSLSKGMEEYAAACRQMLASLGPDRGGAEDGKQRSGVCYIVITGNRGLCGTYNIELFRKVQAVIDSQERQVSLVLIGKWAAENAASLRGAQILHTQSMPELPAFEDAERLCRYMQELYDSGFEEVSFLVQRFKNVLVQTPEVLPFLPARGADEVREDLLFFPDERTVRESTAALCRNVSVFEVLLNCAKGLHGATLAAMRTASDNSTQMVRQLSDQLNRLRQTAATTEVIELSGAALSEYE